MTISMEKCFLFPCLILLATSSIVQSQFDTGATVNECESLQPAGVNPSTGTAPFIVAVTSQLYSGGNAVNVFIASAGTVNVRGLVIQARRANSFDTSPVGSFAVPDNNLYRSLTCGTSTTDTLTNTDASTKTLPLSFMWTSSENVGDVNFFVSLAETNGNFWSSITQFNPLPPGIFIDTCPTPTIQSPQASWTSPTCMRDNTVLANSATCNPPSGSVFSEGNTEVTCECEDQGETSSCSFIVTIDGNPPEPPTCPGPQTAIAPPGSNSVSVQYNVVLCNDIEDGVFLANCLPPSGFQFGIETTAVVCTCADSDGLVSSCSFQVIVTGNACNPNPCQNAGTCFEVPTAPNGFICQCLDGFDGPTCTGNACNPNPCQNAGTCFEVPSAPNGFFCQCLDGFDGPTCTGDACNPNPCQNGGTCSLSTATLSGFVCTCAAGFNLPFCTGIPGGACDGDPCSGNECRTSTSSLAGYTCHSAVGTPCQ